MSKPLASRIPPWVGLVGGLVLGASLGVFVSVAVAAEPMERAESAEASAGARAETANVRSPPPSPSAGMLRPGPPPLERFVKPLALSARQQETLRPIFAAAQQQAAADLKEARADGADLQSTEVRAQWQSREADFRERLSAVLTPEQLAGYDRLMHAEHEARQRPAGTQPVHGHHEMDTPATASEAN